MGIKHSLIRDIPDAGLAFRNGRAISAWAEAIAAHNPMPDAQLA